MKLRNMTQRALLVGMLVAIPRIAQGEQQFVVTTTRDGGNGSFRRAITDANTYGNPCKIVFDIPSDDEGYNACFHCWSIKPCHELPAICTPVEIDGYSQTGAVPNTNPIDEENNAHIAVELSGPGLDEGEGMGLRGLFRGLTFKEGSHGSSVKGLAINNCPVGIEVSASDIALHGNFLGTAVDGFTLKDNLVSVHITDSASDTNIGDEQPCNRNLIAGLGRQLAQCQPVNACSEGDCGMSSDHDTLGAITNRGAFTSIKNSTVNLTRSGHEALTRAPGHGILSVANQGTLLGGPDKAHRVVVANYEGANIQFDSTYNDIVKQVYSGTNTLGKNALGGGAGIRFINRFGVSQEVINSRQEPFLHYVNESLFSGNQGSGIVIGQSNDPYPVSLLNISNTFSGTDYTGTTSLPNNKHGIEINQGVDTSVINSVFNYNHIHGAYGAGSLRTTFQASDLSFNLQDGINYVPEGEALAPTSSLRVNGSFVNNCNSNSQSYAVNKWGSQIFCE